MAERYSGGQLSVLAPSEHSRGPNPVTLCKLFTTVGLRRPFLCFSVGSGKRTMFIKSKAKSLLSESLRNGRDQVSGWMGGTQRLYRGREKALFLLSFCCVGFNPARCHHPLPHISLRLGIGAKYRFLGGKKYIYIQICTHTYTRTHT